MSKCQTCCTVSTNTPENNAKFPVQLKKPNASRQILQETCGLDIWKCHHFILPWDASTGTLKISSRIINTWKITSASSDKKHSTSQRSQHLIEQYQAEIKRYWTHRAYDTVFMAKLIDLQCSQTTKDIEIGHFKSPLDKTHSHLKLINCSYELWKWCWWTAILRYSEQMKVSCTNWWVSWHTPSRWSRKWPDIGSSLLGQQRNQPF